MKLVVLSDIHANLSALDAVINDFQKKYIYDSIIILGDIINYGMRPNETINRVRSLAPSICIFGNHEKAIIDNDLSKFSTNRGKEILEYTAKLLSPDSKKFILFEMEHSGMSVIENKGKRILFVHGSLTDPFWGKMTCDERKNTNYAEFDFVISGHSHIPGYSISLFDDQSNVEFRYKHKTIFLNPGSVGQPRNHNPLAQYLFIDTENETFDFNCVKYDITTEQKLYNNKKVDPFYKVRLEKGI